jgi:hypothetical protein
VRPGAQRLALRRTAAFGRAKPRLSDEKARGNVERYRKRQEHLSAQIGRAALDPLQIAQVLPRPFSEGFLRHAEPVTDPPNVGGDGSKKLG